MNHVAARVCLGAALVFIAAVLLLSGAHVPVSSQGGGRPTATPKPKPRSTPRPSPRATPRSSTRPTPAQSTPRQTAPEIEMVLIPAGTFTMGSPNSEAGRSRAEGPQHRVTLNSFYIGKYEVTQAQWRAVMGSNPATHQADDLPVANVTWHEAVEFCRKLSQMTGREYRLPTEAEWEYAARAGTTTPFAFGASLSSEQANFDGEYPYGGAPKGIYRAKATPAGTFQPNDFGLYDMHGNVWEWCMDYWHESYTGAPTNGSAWMSGGDSNLRVVRGGSWLSNSANCRSAGRNRLAPDYRGAYNGLRIVMVAAAAAQ